MSAAAELIERGQVVIDRYLDGTPDLADDTALTPSQLTISLRRQSLELSDKLRGLRSPTPAADDDDETEDEADPGPATPRPKPRKQQRTGKRGGDNTAAVTGTWSITCKRCSRGFEAPRKSGRRPSLCPSCKSGAPQAAPAQGSDAS